MNTHWKAKKKALAKRTAWTLESGVKMKLRL
jgi:hypothetical protein